MNSRDETALIPSGNPPDSCDDSIRFFHISWFAFGCREIVGGYSRDSRGSGRRIAGGSSGIVGGYSGDGQGIVGG